MSQGVKTSADSVPAPGAGVSVTTVAAAFNANSPIVTPLASGSFVPTGTKHELMVDICHDFWEAASSAANWQLFVGPATTSPITPLHQYDALGAGVQRFKLGGGSGPKINMHRKSIVTGLTPGITYNWELAASPVGGLNGVQLAGAFMVGVSKQVTANPELGTVAAVRSNSTGAVSIYRLRGFTIGPAAPELMGTIALANNTNFGRVAVSPDGTKVAVAVLAGNQIAIINTNCPTASGSMTVPGTWVPAQIASSPFTVPGTNPFPWGIACNDNTYAWFVAQGTSLLYRIHMGTGVIDTPGGGVGVGYALGTTVSGDLALTPDGLYALIPGTFGVKKVRLTDGVVVATYTTARMNAICVDAAGTYCYAAHSADTTMVKLRVSDLGLVTSATIIAGCNRIAIFNDGKSIWCAFNTAVSQFQMQQFLTSDLSLFVNTRGSESLTAPCYDVAIGPYGSIWAPCPTQNSIYQWPGGEIRYNPVEGNPGGAYYDHDISVTSTQLA